MGKETAVKEATTSATSSSNKPSYLDLLEFEAEEEIAVIADSEQVRYFKEQVLAVYGAYEFSLQAKQTYVADFSSAYTALRESKAGFFGIKAKCQTDLVARINKLSSVDEQLALIARHSQKDDSRSKTIVQQLASKPPVTGCTQTLAELNCQPFPGFVCVVDEEKGKRSYSV